MMKQLRYILPAFVVLALGGIGYLADDLLSGSHSNYTAMLYWLLPLSGAVACICSALYQNADELRRLNQQLTKQSPGSIGSRHSENE